MGEDPSPVIKNKIRESPSCVNTDAPFAIHCVSMTRISKITLKIKSVFFTLVTSLSSHIYGLMRGFVVAYPSFIPRYRDLSGSGTGCLGGDETVFSHLKRGELSVQNHRPNPRLR